MYKFTIIYSRCQKLGKKADDLEIQHDLSKSTEDVFRDSEPIIVLDAQRHRTNARDVNNSDLLLW